MTESEMEDPSRNSIQRCQLYNKFCETQAHLEAPHRNLKPYFVMKTVKARSSNQNN